MKKLVQNALLLLLFIISGMTLAQTEANWIKDKKTGCKTFNPSPVPEHSVKFTGTCVEGFLQGHGIVIWYENDKQTGKSEGFYIKGKLVGQGVRTFADGDKYVGEFKDGKYGGQGAYTHANGDRYVGEFKDGKYGGQGQYTTAAGDKLIGIFKNGVGNGKFNVTYADGSSYVGDFDNSVQPNGRGIMTLANGDEYKGEFKDGTFDGQGVYKKRNGFTSLGDYKAGKIYGRYINYIDGIYVVSGLIYGGKYEYQEIAPEAFDRIAQSDIPRPPPDDGSPDHRVCNQYGFTVGTVPYAECRQKIDLARQQSVQNEKYYALEQQRYQAQLTEYERVKRQRESDAWIRLGNSLLGNQSPHFGVALGNGLADMQGLPRPPAAPSPQYFLIVGPKGQVTCSMLQNMVNCF